MTRNRLSLLLALGLLLLALLGWGLYRSIEFYEETEQSSWSLEALRNPYLAAQQFMARSDIEVTDVDSLVKLDRLEGLGTLFFSDANQVQDPRQLKQVMDWLHAGGNVIYTANAVDHEDDLLLSTFGVAVHWREHESGEDRESRSLSETLREYNRQIEDGKSREEIAKSFGQAQQPLTRVGFGDDIGDLEIAFDTERVLQHASFDDSSAEGEYQPFSWSSSEHGVHMMQFDVGAGLLTIVSDPGIWTSYRIGEHDHAWLLWLLSTDEGSFAILRTVLRESIWTLTQRNASELLLALGLLLAAWMWRSGYRFGRLLPRDRSRQRALGEHFSSVSHYLWHRRRTEHLLAPLRQAVLRRASLTLGGFARADQGRQFELLAERCDIEVGAIARVFGSNDFNEASFVSTVRLLKHIEQSL
jgi:hypothetical protein